MKTLIGVLLAAFAPAGVAMARPLPWGEARSEQVSVNSDPARP